MGLDACTERERCRMDGSKDCLCGFRKRTISIGAEIELQVAEGLPRWRYPEADKDRALRFRLEPTTRYTNLGILIDI